MKLGPIVWSDRHRLHEPGGEVWIGVRAPGTDASRRAEAIRDALHACDHVNGTSAAAATTAAPVALLDIDGHRGTDHREAGRLLRGLGPPTVLVPEGGCDLTTIGPVAAQTPARAQEGATRA
jgi:hypothetical protein